MDGCTIDDSRSRYLAGGESGVAYVAATVIDSHGVEHFVLAKLVAIGDSEVRFDPTCAAVEHEQVGPLPLEVVRRFTIASRTTQRSAEALPDDEGAP